MMLAITPQKTNAERVVIQNDYLKTSKNKINRVLMQKLHQYFFLARFEFVINSPFFLH